MGRRIVNLAPRQRVQTAERFAGTAGVAGCAHARRTRSTVARSVPYGRRRVLGPLLRRSAEPRWTVAEHTPRRPAHASAIAARAVGVIGCGQRRRVVPGEAADAAGRVDGRLAALDRPRKTCISTSGRCLAAGVAGQLVDADEVDDARSPCRSLRGCHGPPRAPGSRAWRIRPPGSAPQPVPLALLAEQHAAGAVGDDGGDRGGEGAHDERAYDGVGRVSGRSRGRSSHPDVPRRAVAGGSVCTRDRPTCASPARAPPSGSSARSRSGRTRSASSLGIVVACVVTEVRLRRRGAPP